MTGPAAVEQLLVAGTRIAYRRRPGDGPPTIYVHGVPTDSRQWLPFLERHEGDAIAFDLPGFGASERPPATGFDYSMAGLRRIAGEFVDGLGIAEYRLVVHDWGALALAAALAEPERLQRLVVIDSVPVLPGYRWHRTARIWRTRGLGELFFATAGLPFVRLALREARPGFRPMPDDFVEMVWSNVRDPATRRAILALYRSADPPALAAAGAGLERVGCPALVVWGAADPYIPARFAGDYASRLPGAERVELADAGHWPWIDRPDVVDRTVAFVTEPAADLDSPE
ncbi:MAG TPA: alpha/beta hydrolase [Solirubrobacterales bacterium]